MKYIAPAYYRDFKCIASACRHSCCVDWEVDVDGDALALYGEMTHPYADMIRASIDYEGTPHFALSEDERCPHLSPSGLCNIITECGEEALCQICRDHPRYRNFYGGVTELGLGLSCEEAARLALDGEGVGFIVSDSEDMTDAEYRAEYPTELFSEDDACLAEEKKRLIALVTDSRRSIGERLKSLLQKSPSTDEIKGLFLSLEMLDESWHERVSMLSADDFVLDSDKLGVFVERTAVAFIYRHLTSESFYEPLTVGAFAALSALTVAALARTPEAFADTLRAYSAEIEYSTENTERILDFIEENYRYEI